VSDTHAEDPFSRAVRVCEEAARQSPAVLVGFSGGKESWAVLDLCCRTFQRVVPFHMYFVPGLRCVQEQMDRAKERYGVTVLYYPSVNLVTHVKNGDYCNTHYSYDDVPDVKLSDVYEWVRAETGVRLLALGMRKADSLSRRRIMARAGKQGGTDDQLHPLADFTKWDVLAYLAVRKIPLPPSTGEATSGIGLTVPSILWLHDVYPDDFQKLLALFPFAEAVVRRREWYGIGDHYNLSGKVKSGKGVERVK